MGRFLGALGVLATVCSPRVALAQRPPARGRGQIVKVVHDPPDRVPSVGPRHAPVTIEFFCDLGDNTPSAQVDGYLMKLHERHPLRLRIMYHLVSRGQTSNPHVEAGLEAFAQGRFREFVDALYGENQRSPRVADLPDVAARAGVDPARIAEALEDGRHSAQIVANHYYRKRRRIKQTPALLVNGLAVDRRPRSLEEVEALYDEAYARAKALLDAGVPLEHLYDRLLDDVAAAQPEPIIGPGSIDGLGPGEHPPLGPPPLVQVDLSRGGHARGPERAPVPIVFFCNFQTRNCGESAGFLEEVAAAYPDEVRLVFRPSFDPTDRRQDRARALHRAALCADRQGRFWSFYDLVLAQARRGAIEASLADGLEKAIEIDGKALARCMKSPTIRSAVEAARRRARASGVRHTPSFVLGGRLYSGTKTFDELAALVDRELAPGVLGRIAPE